MPKQVNHEQRKLEILEAGLKVLNSNKFTFEKVATVCGISRTGVYVYYKNKKDIVNDIEANLDKLSKVERTKYILKYKGVSDDKYEKIFEILEG